MTLTQIVEPLTYGHRAGDVRHSFILDLARGDADSRARLARHAHEMAVESRVNPNTTLGTGGEFTPPLWAIGLFGVAPQGARILSDLIDRVGNRFVLPPGVSEVDVPRIVVGAVDDVQRTQGAAGVSVDQTTATARSPVVTLAGNLDVSQQLLDQSPPPGFDTIAAADLAASYDNDLEVQLLNGTGTNGQLTGVGGSASAGNIIDGTTATTISLIWPMFGKAAAAVGNNRKRPLSHWIMAPRRWAWIASSLDSSNRPITSPGNPAQPIDYYGGIGMSAANEVVRPVGQILSMNVWQSGAIPAGANSDYVVGVRPHDMYLWESTPKVAVVASPLSGTLQARIQLRRYVAFVGNRYPSGIGVINNIPQPSGF